MGLFDTFIAKAICPYCKEEKEYDFQTKKFECEMDAYKVGDRILYCPVETGIMKRVASAYCKQTDRYFSADFKIKNCHFVGIARTITGEQEEEERKREEKRWKKTKKYKEQRKAFLKNLRWWRKLAGKRRKKGFLKPRPTYLINLKNPPDLSILKKKEIRRYRFKKLMKDKIIFEILKENKGRLIK